MSYKIEKKIDFTLFIVLMLFSLGFFTYCANPASPQGGPKDTIAPKLVSVDPLPFSTNFSAERITMVFNEYIQLKNSQTEIIVSPEMVKRPRFTVKGKSLLIDFDEKLDSAITYKIDFGIAIQDNNESNPLMNFSYVFSTGDEIDSLAMSGQVIDAFTGDSVLNALILLFDARKDSTELDSVLIRSLPNSIARTDSNGVFIATNLKDIDYKIYALSEETTDGKYNRGSDLVAFNEDLFNPATLPPFKVWYNPIRQRVEAEPQGVFKLFGEDAALVRQNVKKTSRPERNIVLIEFAEKNPEVVSIKLDSVEFENVVVNYSKNRDSLKLFYPYMENMPDTLKGWIEYSTVTADSLAKDTIVVKEFKHSFFVAKDRKKDNKKSNDKASSGSDRRGGGGGGGERPSGGGGPPDGGGERPQGGGGERPEGGDEENPEGGERAGGQMQPEGKDGEKTENPFRVTTDAEKSIHPDNFISFNFGMPLISVDTARISLIQEIKAEKKSSRGARGSQEAQSSNDQTEAQLIDTPFAFTPDSIDVLKWYLKANWKDGSNYKLTIADSTFLNILQERNDSITASFSILKSEEFGTVNINLEGRDSTINYIVMLTQKKETKYQIKQVDSDRITFKYIKPGEYSIKVIEDRDKNSKWSSGILEQRVLPERVGNYKKDGNSIFEVKENWEIDDITVDLNLLFP
ncbi:MAG: Ig-like domain-containing protein [Rikenellaceae bacterium]